MNRFDLVTPIRLVRTSREYETYHWLRPNRNFVAAGVDGVIVDSAHGKETEEPWEDLQTGLGGTGRLAAGINNRCWQPAGTRMGMVAVMVGNATGARGPCCKQAE